MSWWQKSKVQKKNIYKSIITKPKNDTSAKKTNYQRCNLPSFKYAKNVKQNKKKKRERERGLIFSCAWYFRFFPVAQWHLEAETGNETRLVGDSAHYASKMRREQTSISVSSTHVLISLLINYTITLSISTEMKTNQQVQESTAVLVWGHTNR